MSHHPSPNRSSTRRNSNITPSKAKLADVGTPLGVYDTNSVRDRIRQWQAQGGGVVTADDVGAEDDPQVENTKPKSRTSKGARTPEKPSRSNKAKHDAGTPIRNSRTRNEGEDERRDRTRSGSAPSKRVVSDAHWRKDRSPPRSTTSSKPTREDTPTWALPDDGIRVSPIREPKTDRKRKSNHERKMSKEESAVGEDTRKTPKRESISGGEDVRKIPKRESIGGDDGVRVYVTPPASRRKSGHPSRRRSNPTVSDEEAGDDLTGTQASLPTVSDERRKSSTPEDPVRLSPSIAKVDSRRRKSSSQRPIDPDDSPSARGAFSEGRTSARSQKGNILSHIFGESRKSLAKQVQEPIPAPRVPSIEAWLNETSDPFIESEEPPVDFIAPLKPTHEKRKPAPKQEPVEDPNQIWEALDTKEGTRRAVHGSRRKRRIPSSAIYEDNPFPADFDSDSGLSGPGRGTTSASKFVDLVKEPPKTSPSPLKRRAARKSVSSPVSDRHKAQKVTEPNDEKDALNEEKDVASVLSSNHTESSVEGPDPKQPLKPRGLNIKRPFPSTGRHRLSTIASVETFNTRQGVAPPSVSELPERTIHHPTIEESEADETRDHFDPNSLKRNNSRLTKHADLISVLSLPRAGNRSIVSARSIRTNRSRLATATIPDLMQELATDETKYMRELRTLVDGVIPVLLTCVLSKSDSAVAAGLFNPSARGHETPNFTRPIVDMGIALERLKTLHRRIPQEDPAALLTWAHGAQRVYAEYLKAWRMGFQDVVVNLAPAESGSAVSGSSGSNADSVDEGLLPRNEKGDVVNGDGERVDVAFLLKRPLVRLKYLAKTVKGINFVKPSAEAELLATKYQKLVDDARQRANEERARLEDESASNIDPSRARDPRTLAPLTGVIIDRTRRVRARDHFNLALQHSSGQLVDCRVELILRDEASETAGGGDVLICEVDGTGRWLLFPPVQFTRISARNGDHKGEIVVMIRGRSGDGSEWQELFSLRTEDEQAGFEWVQMLGLTPVPPKINRSQSFVAKRRRSKSTSELAPSSLAPSDSASQIGKSRTPSPREVDIPIGEQAHEASKIWEEPSKNVESPSTLSPRHGARSQKPAPNAPPSTPSKVSTNYVDKVNDLRSLPSQSKVRESPPPEPRRTPRSFKEALGLSGTSNPISLKRAKATRLSRHGGSSPSSPRSIDGSRQHFETDRDSPDAPEQSEPVVRSAKDIEKLRSASPEPIKVESPRKDGDHQDIQARPPNHRKKSSVPSLDLPYIPRVRKDSPPSTPTIEPEEEPVWPSPIDTKQSQSPSKLTKRRPVSSKAEAPQLSSPPATPPHRSPSPVQLNKTKTPILSSSKVKPRRSSSPLKHEYEPSTASESSSDSETSTVAHNEATSISDSSDDEELEDGDVATPLLPLGTLKSLPSSKQSPKPLVQSTPASTIKPSESASQAPYKTVPAQPRKAAKTIASIYSWSDTGSWQSLHPDECSIVITPGLIEAFEMSAAHSKFVPPSAADPVADLEAFSDLASNLTSQNDDVRGDRPLVALELTPLVPLRRGTALDISIRSPPTPNSQITSGNNIMFRSRNPEECEALYALINHSRINNPTFIALQNARAAGSSFHPVDRRASTSASGSRHSWFGGWGRSSSYRASSAPTPSIAISESSIGSMSSAFSALKRFGKGSGMFNIARSTITSRDGSRANSVYASSDNSSGSGTNSPVPGGLVSAGTEAPIGLSNAKIRLYLRETASRWRDMGSARLTIMRPEISQVGPDGRPTSGGAGGAHHGVNEKRIVVNGKTQGEVLLDVQLGESCFERVARTGIALSVWEDVVGPNGEVGGVAAQGGVAGGRARVYMIQVCCAFPYEVGVVGMELVLTLRLQMKSEAETAYTFSIVGKLRY